MGSRHCRTYAPLARRMVVAAVAGSLALSVLGAAAPSALVPSASAWTVSTAARTEAEVRATWAAFKPAYTGAPYSAAPSIVAPYAAGDAAAAFRVDGLNMLNFGRYLAGLPYDVALTAERNAQAQHGAVLLAASTFSHEPPKPAGMTDEFYATALSSTCASNIGSGHLDSESFQKSCLDDGSASNIVRVGHRRWLLNPTMRYTGIGFAENRHTTYAFDSSRPAAEVSYDVIAWPSAGVFPVEFATKYTPWSVTLNPARYDWDATVSGHTATIRRVSDGRTWVMDASDTSTSGEYFNADFSYIGSARNVFVFRPNPADLGAGYAAGQQYDVTLSGGIYAEGTRTPVSVSYRTSFGALTGAATSFSASIDPGAAPPLPEPAPGELHVYRFYNLRNGSHFYTASATERDTVLSTLKSTYQLEGVAYAIDTMNPANASPLYRFYNRANGSHFYTASAAERDQVIAALSATYAYEGPAYNVSTSAGGCAPMFRFHNKRNGSHFYTTSAAERDQVAATLADVYAYDGVAYYVAQ